MNEPEQPSGHLFRDVAAATAAFLESSPPPLDAITKIIWMRGWVDDVLDEFVQDARANGAGWDQIATALGVTRQAAWARYRKDTDPMTRPARRADRGYLTSARIWDALVVSMQPGRWYDLQGIYQLVLSKEALSDRDEEPDAPGSNSLRWHRNVRNVLQRRKGTGDLEWDGGGSYRLA